MDIRDPEKRKMICQECEYFQQVKNDKLPDWINERLATCKQCHCLMSAKWIIPGAKCPIGKW